MAPTFRIQCQPHAVAFSADAARRMGFLLVFPKRAFQFAKNSTLAMAAARNFAINS